MRFSMLYSGEQILSFKSCFVFYAGDSWKMERQKRKKIMGWIIRSNLIPVYMIPILHFVPSFNFLCLTVPEKNVTKKVNIWKLERKKNEEIKGHIHKKQQPDTSIHNTPTHTHQVYQVSTLYTSQRVTVPEKSVMKNFNDWEFFICLCWGFTALSTDKVMSSRSVTH